MKRRKYETDADRAQEKQVFDLIARRLKCSYRRFPSMHTADGVLFVDDKPVALAEIKTRRNPYKQYPTYMLSAYKWRKILELSDKYGLPALLFVSFTDGVYVTQLRRAYRTDRGGRTDRNDALDVERCIFIPMEQFKVVS